LFPCTRLAVIALASMVCFSAAVVPLSAFVHAADAEYTYYGWIPRDIWDMAIAVMAGHDVGEWMLDVDSVRTYATAVVIGNHDSTSVRVYTLPDKSLVKEFTVNKLENVQVRLSNGTFFKAVSNKPVTVMLMGGRNVEAGTHLTTTFLTSTDGSYAGKEFILLAVQSGQLPWGFPGLPYRLYALQDSDVSVQDAEGKVVASLKVSVNKVHEFSVTPSNIYRLTSTGYVMLQMFFLGWLYPDRPWYPSGTCFYPAVKGGFAGTTFYGSGIDPKGYVEVWGIFQPPQFIASSVEESKLAILDIENRRKLADLTVPSMGDAAFEGKVPYLILESDKPVLALLRYIGMSYAGLAAGQTSRVYVPADGVFAGEAYIFTYKETVVTVDDVMTRLPPDGVMPLRAGFHKVSTTENILLQVANWPAPSAERYSRLGKVPEFMRLSDFAVCVPSVESLSITHGDLTVKPLLETGIPWMYIAAAVVPILVVLAWLMMRRRKPAQSQPNV